MKIENLEIENFKRWCNEIKAQEYNEDLKLFNSNLNNYYLLEV